MTSVYSAKVSSKGQIFLPREVREMLGLQPGDRLEMQVLKGRTLLAQKVMPSAFEQAVARLEQEITRPDLSAAAIGRALEQVKRELAAAEREEDGA